MPETIDNKILSFEQGAAFYFAKYRRHIEQRQYTEALQALRTACEKAPENIEYSMELAQLYTEMDFFLESNHILLRIFPDNPSYQEECLYGMGCNFFGLQDVNKAKECFEKILEYYPNGAYSNDAADFLDYLEFDLMAESPLSAEDIAEADRGKTALDGGEAERAKEIFSRLSEKYPAQAFLKNNLALAHYCGGETDRAIEISKQVLMLDRYSPHAICNLLLFSAGAGDTQSLARYRPLLDRANCREADDDLKVALTYCELGEDEKAYPLFRRALEDVPYDYQALYFAAACAQNIGKAREAEHYLADMAKLWPEDSVVAYYLQEVRRCRKEGIALHMAYNCQVPDQEIHERLIYLNGKFLLTDAQLREAWQNEQKFYNLVLWGMNAGGETARRMIVSVLGRIGDARAQDILRKWLLRRYETDDIKNLILFALHRLGAEQPYVAYISGKMTEVRMGETATEVPDTYDAVLQCMIQLLDKLDYKLYLPNAVGLFSEFLQKFEVPPKLRRYTDWAAALALLTLRIHGVSIHSSTVAEQLELSALTVTRALRYLLTKLPEYQNYATE